MWKCKERPYIQLTLGIWFRPLSQHPLLPARQQPHLMPPSVQTTIQEETKDSEKRPNSQQIILYCLNWFPRVKFRVFECSCCSFTVCACLWLICMFFWIFHCTLFVNAAFSFKTCICLYLCWFVYVSACMLCECLCINCQTTRALQESQTIFKIFLSKENVFY